MYTYNDCCVTAFDFEEILYSTQNTMKHRNQKEKTDSLKNVRLDKKKRMGSIKYIGIIKM